MCAYVGSKKEKKKKKRFISLHYILEVKILLPMLFIFVLLICVKCISQSGKEKVLFFVVEGSG